MMLKKYDGKGVNIGFLRQAISPMLKHLLISQASGTAPNKTVTMQAEGMPSKNVYMLLRAVFMLDLYN